MKSRALEDPGPAVSRRTGVSERGVWSRWKSLLGAPVNGASLAAFRIAVGAVMALEAWSLCRPSASSNGKIPLEVFYTGADVKLHFPYAAFDWLPVLPTHWLQIITGVLGLAGLLMAAGFCYRLSAVLVFLSWGYLYAIESTRTYWMSYHYLELLATFLMIWMPAARRMSVDAWLGKYFTRPVTASGKRRETKMPAQRGSSKGRGWLWLGRAFTVAGDGSVPFWTLLLLRGQLVITYFYAGVAKLNADWLLDAQPVRYYLSQARWLEDYGPYLRPNQLALVKHLLQSDALAYFLSYAGAAFDLGVGFLLLFRRTRVFAMVLMLIFHGTNHFLIFNDIEWFPLLGVLTATIFFEPDWPERCWKWLRKPRIARPDWGWLLGGALLLPVVGAFLGWKSSRAVEPDTTRSSVRLGSGVAVFVGAWLAWQAVMPCRQYLIAGDSRFTWEGLAFSWRLKAEVYRCTPCELTLEDQGIISRDDSGRGRVQWNGWRGEPVLYRTLTPGRVDWARLPELIVTLEPLVGERILYNPFAGVNQGRSETEARARVNQIWQELYGHPPALVRRTASPEETLTACVPTLRKRGYAIQTTLEAEERLKDLLAKNPEDELTSILRQTHPLALQGGTSPAVPFLLIEDGSLARNPGTSRMTLDSRRWKQSAYSRCERDSRLVEIGGPALIVFTGSSLFELRDKLPMASLFDAEDQPQQLPVIYWNYLRELTYAQAMHMSLQPFLLRNYARHVADLWEQTYGRRPIVHAQTAVSLNFRPAEAVVDPSADLASVSASQLHHNPWIRQLQCARIPHGVK